MESLNLSKSNLKVLFAVASKYTGLLKPHTAFEPIIARGTPLPPNSLCKFLFSSDFSMSYSHQLTFLLVSNCLALVQYGQVWMVKTIASQSGLICRAVTPGFRCEGL